MNKNFSSTIILVLLGAILILSGFLNGEEKQVRQIIAFKYHNNISNEQINEVNKAFRSLQNKVPGILALEVGTNPDEGILEGEFSHTFMLTFATEKARKAYLPHPERQKFENMINHLGTVEKSFVIAFSTQN